MPIIKIGQAQGLVLVIRVSEPNPPNISSPAFDKFNGPLQRLLTLSDLQGASLSHSLTATLRGTLFEIKLLVPKRLCCCRVFQNYNLPAQGEAHLYSVRSTHFCTYIHISAHTSSERQVSRELPGSAGLLLHSWTQVIRLLSPQLISQDVGSEVASYANSLRQERHLLVSALPFPGLHACQTPHVLSIFI